MSEIVDDVRELNRCYTRVVGLLRPELASSSFGLAEARGLFELAHSNGLSASELRRELDLDAGHLSRRLGAFGAAGLVDRDVARRRAPSDRPVDRGAATMPSRI